MKRFFLFLTLFLSCALTNLSAQNYWTDEGNFCTDWYDSTTTSFMLSTAEELAGLAYLVNIDTLDFSGKTITLANDIDLSGHEWVAIGCDYEISKFSGVFDGNQHIIENMISSTQKTSNAYGLFGMILNAEIKNVGIAASCHICVAQNRVSGVVGQSYNSFITNCFNEGTIEGSWYVSGIASFRYKSTVIHCHNKGTIIGDGYVGGVTAVDYISPTIQCYNEGTVTAYHSVGGVSGWAGYEGNHLTDCYNIGNVQGHHSVGGILGSSTIYNVVSNCYNTGTIVGETDNVGGIVGMLIDIAEVVNCHNSGTVIGTNFIGGIVGWMISYSSINNCYNTGELSGNQYIGGIIGYSQALYGDAYINNCYNIGTVSGEEFLGGILSFDEGMIAVVNCNYLNTCVNEYNNFGNPLSQTEMQSQHFVDSLNFNANNHNLNVPDEINWHHWLIESGENDGFPIFGEQVGFKENESQNIDVLIFPNPTDDAVTLKFSEKSLLCESINIFDLSGKLVKSQSINSHDSKIFTKNLENGVYWLQIIFKNHSMTTKKLIIRH